MSRSHTLVHRIAELARTRADAPALHGKDTGSWSTLTWSGYWEAVREVGAGLLALGHEAGECVALVGVNRVDWVLAQFGIMAVRGVPAPIYTTLLPDQVAWIVEHSEARIAVCDGQEQLDKLHAALAEGRMPRLAHIVTMDPVASDDGRVLSLAQLRSLGRAQPAAALDARLAALTDTEVALLIYTSGTTGTPKAVQLDHGGAIAVAEALLDRFSMLREDYRALSYLPLCHVAEQVFTNFLQIQAGGEVSFCPDLRQVKDYLVDARPTVFLGVPRVWEKFQAALERKLGEATGVKAWLTAWARRTELDGFRADVARGDGQVRIGFLRGLARRLVIDKVKAALGLERLAVAASGAAPIAVETLEFFASLGIGVYEGYGMSETTGIATAPSYGRLRFGTVGTALSCAEVRIAADGEVLLKGRGMTRGYLRQPEHTAELLDAEGWLHTGDLGSVDGDGFLTITGRKKDILITAGGKNIAPAEMEGYIKQIVGVSQVVVVGDRQPFLVALLTLDAEALGELAARAGVPVGSVAAMAGDPNLVRWLQAEVERVCNARVAQYQTIKRIGVLPVEFTVDTGEVTPTMKVKRNVVNEKFAGEIAALYG